MSKILVLYYSQSGNTEKMANQVAEGAKNGGADVELSYHIDAEDLSDFDAIIVGSPTYHHDMPLEIKRLFEDASGKGVNLKGKVGAAFGSFGWSGEAPKFVLEILKNRFEMDVIEMPLILKYTPDAEGLNRSRALGKLVSEKLIPPA